MVALKEPIESWKSRQNELRALQDQIHHPNHIPQNIDLREFSGVNDLRSRASVTKTLVVSRIGSYVGVTKNGLLNPKA